MLWFSKRKYLKNILINFFKLKLLTSIIIRRSKLFNLNYSFKLELMPSKICIFIQIKKKYIFY